MRVITPATARTWAVILKAIQALTAHLYRLIRESIGLPRYWDEGRTAGDKTIQGTRFSVICLQRHAARLASAEPAMLTHKMYDLHVVHERNFIFLRKAKWT